VESDLKPLGSLEQEIVTILWRLGHASVKEIHSAILSDPNRELTAPSILTVLRRLEKKGWVIGQKKDRIWYWRTKISQSEAKIKTAYMHLQGLLTIGDGEVVTSFADHLDHTSMDRLAELTKKLQAIRSEREKE